MMKAQTERMTQQKTRQHKNGKLQKKRDIRMAEEILQPFPQTG